ncbi:MAG: hypothetical protein K0S37_3708 [Microbacterium sp.]|nr:hypothetical protein [Microbacterium sp.]
MSGGVDHATLSPDEVSFIFRLCMAGMTASSEDRIPKPQNELSWLRRAARKAIDLPRPSTPTRGDQLVRTTMTVGSKTLSQGPSSFSKGWPSRTQYSYPPIISRTW